MSIRKRGTGWQVRVHPFPNLTVPTRKAAETVELDLKIRLKLGHLYQERPSTLGAELDGHIDRKRSMGGRRGRLRPRSVEFYEQSAKAWGPLRQTLVPNLRRAIVEDRVAARAAEAPVAAGNELALLKAALRDAASRGQVVDVGIFEIPTLAHEPAEGVALEYAQLEEIASWLPERVKRIVPFVGTAGLRFTEAVTLTDERVDLDAGTLLIPRDLAKGRRVKPIALARVEVQLLREQMLARPAGTRLVFPTMRGGVYSKSGFRSVWLPALLAAGFAHLDEKGQAVADFRFHWLRHTAISLMARAGMKPELIADRVGHKDGGALIYRRYRHLFPGELRAAVGLLDELLAPTSDGQGMVRADA